MAVFAQYTLSTGWYFKDRDDLASDAWMPVPVVPSVVHQDLQANGKCVLLRNLSRQTSLTYRLDIAQAGEPIRGIQ